MKTNIDIQALGWPYCTSVLAFTQADKFLPRYQRKKVLEEQRPPPVVFEMIPSSGMMSPGERVNVQIKFSPTQGVVLLWHNSWHYMSYWLNIMVKTIKAVLNNKDSDLMCMFLQHVYNRRLVVRVAESTQQVFITVQGQGELPQLEFCPSVLELGPCLPASTEAEAEITVRNPCSFPIEFYSLEFDTQYLEEEKVFLIFLSFRNNVSNLIKATNHFWVFAPSFKVIIRQLWKQHLTVFSLFLFASHTFPVSFFYPSSLLLLHPMQILHLMKDYDENNILLLPPRAPGESLPTELLDYYNEYCSQLKDDGSYRHSQIALFHCKH